MATPIKREASNEPEEESPSKKSKSKPLHKSSPLKGNTARANLAIVADSYDDLSAEDKMLIDWRDAGKSWAEIEGQWESLTGKKPGDSTMRKRYPRVKAAITNVKPADRSKIAAAREESLREIEAQKKSLDTKLWAFVAEKMKTMGTDEYAPATVEKQWKKMSTNTTTAE